jgi:hypothetical protein
MPGVEPDIYGVRGTHLQSDWDNDWSKFHRHAEFQVLSTIIHRGQVIGTWAWDASKMAVAYSIMRGYGSPELGKAARR